MDWINRGSRPNQPTGQPVQDSNSAPTRPVAQNNTKSFSDKSKLMQVITGLLFVSVGVLLIALVSFLAVGKGSPSESKFIDSSKMQAVFLNGGQVYFGRIQGLNNKYMRVNDIYYLRVNQQVQPNQNPDQAQNDISLVKLGCELHGPQDQMIINREQVVFWENLKSDGQVAQAVEEYRKQNPEGQKCETPQAQNETTTNQQNTNTSTTPTTNNTNTNNQNR